MLLRQQLEGILVVFEYNRRFLFAKTGSVGGSVATACDCANESVEVVDRDTHNLTIHIEMIDH